MGEKAVWDDAHIKHFIDICKEEISVENRPTGCFTRNGWKNLEVKFLARSRRKLVKSQLKNKLDNMKKDYTQFMELKNAATGLGWDDAKQIVDCSSIWWDEHLERYNNPKKGIKCNHTRFRKRGPKHLDDLHFLFDKVHVTRATASCLGDVSSYKSSDEDVVEIEKCDDIGELKLAASKKPKAAKKRKESSSAAKEKDEKSPFYRLYKNTCFKIETAADKITQSVEASVAPSASYHVPTIAEVMKMVKKYGVQEKTALMHTATLLIVKPDFRKIFSLLQTNKGRFNLLEREHEKENMKHM